jgi:hypothetical protein
MLYRYAILFLLLIAFSRPALAQRDSVPLNSIIEKAGKLSTGRPVEKVYVHFDKPYYAVGDTIWFKTYVTDNFRQPSQLSKVVYVEIANSRDSIVDNFKLPVRNGVATGNIALNPLSYKQDNYHVRAYTKWMANFDASYFFTKSISVGNAVDKLVNTQVTYSKTGADKSMHVNLRLVYKDPDGVPQANKRVSWEVMSTLDDIAKGKGNTDASGAYTISFVNSKATDLSNASVVAFIDLGNKKTAGRTFPLKPLLNNNDVQFFPEGGELLNAVRTKVGIKTVGGNGLGASFTGTITDNAGQVMANVTSQHAGMGMFVLTPEEGKTYKADITFANGVKGTYNLPKVQTTGFAININSGDADQLSLKLSASPTYFQANKGKAFYIIAQSVNTVCFAAQTLLKEQIYSATVPKNKFPTGIVQFTLMSSAGVPLSERLVFVQQNDQLNLSIAGDKPSYASRQKVKLNIAAKNKTSPVEGNFSIAVIDEGKVPVNESDETTILSSLLLTSDLKGYIEKPNYYFTKINDKTAADLDLLMLTQGYRRFTYTDIIANNYPQVLFLPEQGIELSGTLRTLNGMPFKGGNIKLLIPDKYFSANATSDPEGRFKFNNLVFADSAKVVVSAKNNYNGKNLMLMMDGQTYPAVPKNQFYPDDDQNIDSTINTYLQNSKKLMDRMRVLKEVVVRAPKATPRIDHSAYPALTGLSNIPDHLITAEQLGGCANMLLCLQGRLPGVTFDNNAFYVSRDYNAGRRVPMQLFVTGMPVDVSYLNNMQSTDIESIEVFLKDELGLVSNSYQANGIIVINSKKKPTGGTKISLAEFQDLLPQPNVVNFTPKGYNFGREFYSPKYEVAKPVGVDLRSTIYWNPHVVTDKATGNTSVEFYNADGKGSYRAVIEGFDKDGNIGRFVYHYKVQ